MEIFPGKGTKGKIIEYVLDRPTTKIKVTSVAQELGISKGHTSEIIDALEREKILRDKLADLKNPYVRSLKTAININKLMKNNIVAAIKGMDVDGAGLYGSWANGSNTEESDIDIWIKCRKDIGALEVAKLSKKIGDFLKAEPQILILTPERLKRIKNDNIVFYFTLALSSVVLLGEGIGQA